MNINIDTLQSIPEKGDFVTVSRNKITGDRSYAHGVWEVVAVSPAHVQLRPKTEREIKFYNSVGIKSAILVLNEHDFFDASSFELD